jgi:hypothetical protein
VNVRDEHADETHSGSPLWSSITGMFLCGVVGRFGSSWGIPVFLLMLPLFALLSGVILLIWGMGGFRKSLIAVGLAFANGLIWVLGAFVISSKSVSNWGLGGIFMMAGGVWLLWSLIIAVLGLRRYATSQRRSAQRYLQERERVL